MRTIETSIDIDAPTSVVWSVVSDLATYPYWNPFIVEAAGALTVGEKLNVRIAPPGGREMRFAPRVLEVVPGRRLRWLGRVGVPGIFDGEHTFDVQDIGPGRCRFVQSERFTGILPPLMPEAFRRTEAGFRAMNTALKEHAERAMVG